MALTALDYIVIALFGVALISALIRGLKHPSTRLEGDLLSFCLAFLLSIVIHGFLLEKVGFYADFYNKMVQQFSETALWVGWIMGGAIFLVLLLVFVPLFRLLYRHNGQKRIATLFLTLFTYLFLAYVLGFICSSIFEFQGIDGKNTTLLDYYEKSTIAIIIYPAKSLLTWMAMLVEGV